MDDGIVFDTHRFIKRLVETGMDERTAEVEAGLSARIAEVEAGLLKKLAELETRLLKWMVGLLVAQTGLVVTLIKLL